MSEIQYGLISRTDANVLEKTIDLICDEFAPNNLMNVTEIGLFDCGTAMGIKEYVYSKQWLIYYTGIDSEKDKPINAPFWLHYIKGNSNEVYNQIEDNSQHLIFVDGCHCFAHVISDFFCYAPKVKVGGYLAFHDTGVHIKPFKDFQHGDKNNPDAYISVRKALQTIGLLEPFLNPKYQNVEGGIYDQWELIFDEADETNEAGGICVFKKLY